MGLPQIKRQYLIPLKMDSEYNKIGVDYVCGEVLAVVETTGTVKFFNYHMQMPQEFPLDKFMTWAIPRGVAPGGTIQEPEQPEHRLMPIPRPVEEYRHSE